MRAVKDEKTDALTKRAWEKNWDDISMDEIMEIFKYDRVKKQMDVFTRVLPKNEKILEGGCGLAPYLIRLRQLGFQVEGIDYNEAPLKKALSHDPTLPLKVGDVAAIPYPDDSFGGYISLGVIEHFTEGPLKAIREARRILRKGGVFVVMVPQNHFFMRLTAPLRALKRNSLLRKWFKKSADTHYWEQYFKRSELVPLLEKEGFDVREVHAMDHSHAFVSFSNFFRDKNTFDEASPLALRLGEWSKKNLPWLMACQLLIIGYKK
jgi:SAM-dependent methyltransferase